MFLAPDRIADTATVAEPPKPQRVLWAERVVYAPNARPNDPWDGFQWVARVFNVDALPAACVDEVKRIHLALASEGAFSAPGDVVVRGRGIRAIPNQEWAAICARYGFKQAAVWNDVQGFWCRVEKVKE